MILYNSGSLAPAPAANDNTGVKVLITNLDKILAMIDKPVSKNHPGVNKYITELNTVKTELTANQNPLNNKDFSCILLRSLSSFERETQTLSRQLELGEIPVKIPSTINYESNQVGAEEQGLKHYLEQVSIYLDAVNTTLVNKFNPANNDELKQEMISFIDNLEVTNWKYLDILLNKQKIVIQFILTNNLPDIKQKMVDKLYTIIKYINQHLPNLKTICESNNVPLNIIESEFQLSSLQQLLEILHSLLIAGITYKTKQLEDLNTFVNAKNTMLQFSSTIEDLETVIEECKRWANTTFDSDVLISRGKGYLKELQTLQNELESRLKNADSFVKSYTSLKDSLYQTDPIIATNLNDLKSCFQTFEESFNKLNGTVISIPDNDHQTLKCQDAYNAMTKLYKEKLDIFNQKEAERKAKEEEEAKRKKEAERKLAPELAAPKSPANNNDMFFNYIYPFVIIFFIVIIILALVLRQRSKSNSDYPPMYPNTPGNDTSNPNNYNPYNNNPKYE